MSNQATQPVSDFPEIKLSWAGEAEINSFLNITPSYTVAINESDYKVVQQNRDGLYVIAFDEEEIFSPCASTWKDAIPVDIEARMEFIPWEEIRTLYIY